VFIPEHKKEYAEEIKDIVHDLDELGLDGELLLECKVGDKHHQALLEVGLNTILERFVKSTFADDKCQK
jgi:hypothetical protein